MSIPFIQVGDLAVRMFHTLNGTIALSVSGFPLWNIRYPADRVIAVDLAAENPIIQHRRQRNDRAAEVDTRPSQFLAVRSRR